MRTRCWKVRFLWPEGTKAARGKKQGELHCPKNVRQPERGINRSSEEIHSRGTTQERNTESAGAGKLERKGESKDTRDLKSSNRENLKGEPGRETRRAVTSCQRKRCECLPRMERLALPDPIKKRRRSKQKGRREAALKRTGPSVKPSKGTSNSAVLRLESKARHTLARMHEALQS